MLEDDEFRCTCCGEIKERSAFYADKRSTTGKVRQPCKECSRSQDRDKRSKYKLTEKVIPEYKVCSDCGEEKHKSEFHKRIDTPTGLRDRCKYCYNSKSREYYYCNSEAVIERTGKYQKVHREDYSRRKREKYSENPEYYREIDRAWRSNNREQINKKAREHRKNNKELYQIKYREYYQKNKDKILTRGREWYKNNKDKSAYYSANRRARIKQATPLWADQDTVKSFYTEAQYFGLSVDHIIPLSHPLVCGLHCEFNLQLLPLQENITKNNKFEIQEHEVPEYFEEDM